MATFPQFFFLLLILPLSLPLFFAIGGLAGGWLSRCAYEEKAPQNFFSMERPSRREKEFPSLILRNRHISCVSRYTNGKLSFAKIGKVVGEFRSSRDMRQVRREG